MENTQKSPDFEKKFMIDQLTEIAKEAAKVNIQPDVFEALLISLADEMNFSSIMQISKGKVK